MQIILASVCIQTDCDAPFPRSSEVVFPLDPQIMLVLQNDSWKTSSICGTRGRDGPKIGSSLICKQTYIVESTYRSTHTFTYFHDTLLVASTYRSTLVCLCSLWPKDI